MRRGCITQNGLLLNECIVSISGHILLLGKHQVGALSLFQSLIALSILMALPLLHQALLLLRTISIELAVFDDFLISVWRVGRVKPAVSLGHHHHYGVFFVRVFPVLVLKLAALIGWYLAFVDLEDEASHCIVLRALDLQWNDLEHHILLALAVYVLTLLKKLLGCRHLIPLDLRRLGETLEELLEYLGSVAYIRLV